MQVFPILFQRFLIVIVFTGLSIASKSQSVPIQTTHRILWLRADAGVLNAAGNPANDGDRVAMWQDQSGDGTPHHFIQNALSRRPIYIRNANGAPAIRFNANDSSSLINTANPFSALYPRTIFIVFRITSPNTEGNSFFSLYSNNGTHAEVFATSNSTYRPLSLAVGFPASVGRCIGVNPGGFHNNVDVFTITYNGATASDAGVGSNYRFYNRTDNPLSGTTSGAYGRLSSDRTSSIGGRASQEILYLSGDIYEILVYDEVLSDTERNRVITNLQGRFPTTFPLTLLDFTARQINKEISLDWKVADEVNISTYYPQYSQDGISWTTIDSIKFQPGGESIKSYHSLHKTPTTGNNFYRIKWVEVNGKTAYSPVRSFYLGTEAEIKIIPTLVTNQITLQTGLKSIFDLEIYNVSGSMVLSKRSVKNNDIVYLNKFPSGMYQVLLSNKQGERKMLRFFKQ